jgi:hypothetical protein
MVSVILWGLHPYNHFTGGIKNGSYREPGVSRGAGVDPCLPDLYMGMAVHDRGLSRIRPADDIYDSRGIYGLQRGNC